MSIWTDNSILGVRRQIAINVLVTHVFSGFTLWECIVSVPYDWHVYKGKRGCKWGAYLLYMNTRHLFLCSTIATLVFVDLYATRFVRGIGTFFQITGHVANGVAYAILALRLIIIWRKQFMTLIMVICQLALWAVTFAAFPRVIDSFQDWKTHVCLNTTLLAISSIMLLSTFWGLVLAYRHHIARLASCKGIYLEDDTMSSISRYRHMLWQEGIQYFIIPWLAQLAEAIVRFMHVDRTGLLQFTFQFAGLSVTILSACRLYREMSIQCDTCPFNEYRIFWRSTRQLTASCLTSLRSLLTKPAKPTIGDRPTARRPRPRHRWKSRPGESDVGIPEVDEPTIDVVLSSLSGKEIERGQKEDGSVGSPRTSFETQSVG